MKTVTEHEIAALLEIRRLGKDQEIADLAKEQMPPHCEYRNLRIGQNRNELLIRIAVQYLEGTVDWKKICAECEKAPTCILQIN